MTGFNLESQQQEYSTSTDKYSSTFKSIPTSSESSIRSSTFESNRIKKLVAAPSPSPIRQYQAYNPNILNLYDDLYSDRNKYSTSSASPRRSDTPGRRYIRRRKTNPAVQSVYQDTEHSIQIDDQPWRPLPNYSFRFTVLFFNLIFFIIICKYP